MALITAFSTFGRAGGGEHFSSSSGSSFSGGGTTYYAGGSGTSTTTAGPFDWIFVIVFFVIIGVGYAARKKGGGTGSSGVFSNPEVADILLGAVNAKDNESIQAKLAAIKQADPGFNEQTFKDKTQNAFFKIQEAWEKQDLNIARPFVSDAIMQRYATQIADMQSRGEKDIMENITIGNMTISNVATDANFTYITVRIDASAIDYTVDATGKMVSGIKDNKPFSESWTMLRTAGVQTNLDKQLQDNKCPNCGAPLEVNASGKCNYCGAIVTSGQYDWVLSEIDQTQISPAHSISGIFHCFSIQ